MNVTEEKPKKKRIYKGKQVNVRFTDEEYAILEAKAKAAGLTVPYILKRAVLEKKISPKKPPKVSDEIALSIASELRHIGRNINQVAKHLNSGGNVHMGLLEALEGILKGLRYIWRALK